jgi:hypothetical protein
MVALYALWANFVRVHKTPRVSPAMPSGIEKRLSSIEDIVASVDARGSDEEARSLQGVRAGGALDFKTEHYPPTPRRL